MPGTSCPCLDAQLAVAGRAPASAELPRARLPAAATLLPFPSPYCAAQGTEEELGAQAMWEGRIYCHLRVLLAEQQVLQALCASRFAQVRPQGGGAEAHAGGEGAGRGTCSTWPREAHATSLASVLSSIQPQPH